MKLGLPIVGLIAAVLALGIVSAARAQGAASGRSCFYSRDIRNIRSSDATTVNVRVTRNDVYQLKLFARCPDISWSHGIQLRTRGGSQICEGSGLNVEVLPSRSMSSSVRSKCHVSNIRRLSPDEVSALSASARP
jgi:hypothetical protein